VTKEELAKQINGAAVCCRNMEILLTAGSKLWTVPAYLAFQAREAQRKAQVKKDIGKEKERKIVRFVAESVLCGGGSCRGDGQKLVLSKVGSSKA